MLLVLDATKLIEYDELNEPLNLSLLSQNYLSIHKKVDWSPKQQQMLDKV